MPADAAAQPSGEQTEIASPCRKLKRVGGELASCSVWASALRPPVAPPWAKQPLPFPRG